MQKNKLEIIVIINSDTGNGMSGGFIRVIEILRRLQNEISVTICGSETVKNICLNYGLENVDYKITTKENKVGNVILLYLKRIFSALRMGLDIEDNTVLYSSSDFLPSTIPAFIWKLKNKNVKWIVCMFLIVPSLFKDYTKTYTVNANKFSVPNITRILHYISQQLTVFIAKISADQILVLNDIDKKHLIEKMGVKKSMITVVDGGINYKELINIQRNDMVYDGIFLGRFHPQKGIFDLIKIWKQVCEKKPKAKLGVMGGGTIDFENNVRKVINDNELTHNVKLLGFKSGNEKFTLLKSSKIFLCPSSYESWCIVIAEAMACGLPVVAYDLPIYNSIYGNNILKAQIGDVHQFAELVIKLLDDANLRNGMCQNGQEFIQKYDWDKIAKRELEIIQNI